MRSIIVISILLFPVSALGQTPSPPSETAHQSLVWLQGFSTAKLNDRWSFPLEIQIRRAETGATWQQFQFRGAVLFKANDHITLGGGYSYINTWPYGEQPVATEFPEHRLYEQLNIRHKVESVPVEHRLRLEQRYVRRIDAASRRLLDEYNYTNRFRYQGGITIPIADTDPSKVERGDKFFFANDEIFFNFGENVLRNKFDQNRVAAGIGYHFSPDSNFRVGYLHQYIQKGNGFQFESNHIITLSLTYNFSLR